MRVGHVRQMAMAGANTFAIQKAMGHKDINTTMIDVDIAKPHIQEQVDKLDRIPLPPVLFARPLHPTGPGVRE